MYLVWWKNCSPYILKVGQYSFPFCLDTLRSIQGHILASLMTQLYRKKNDSRRNLKVILKFRFVLILCYIARFLRHITLVRITSLFYVPFLPQIFFIILESEFHRHNLNYFKKRIILTCRKPRVENNVVFFHYIL